MTASAFAATQPELQLLNPGSVQFVRKHPAKSS